MSTPCVRCGKPDDGPRRYLEPAGIHCAVCADAVIDESREFVAKEREGIIKQESLRQAIANIPVHRRGVIIKELDDRADMILQLENALRDRESAIQEMRRKIAIYEDWDQ